MKLSLPILAGIIGAIISIILTILNNRKYKEMLVDKKMPMDKFRNLSKSSYEVYYIGPKRDLALFNIDGIKQLDYKELILLRNKKSVDELPFDLSKNLIIGLMSANFVTQLDVVANQFGFEYIYLGDRRELKYKKKK